MKQGLSVVMLAYKEEENLRVLIPEIKGIVDKLNTEYEILVVDTETPLDHTEDVCKEFGCRYINQTYPHFGGAFRTAIEHVEYDKFLILDGDGSHPPVHITDIYNLFVSDAGYDMVIGSRYVKGGITHDAKSSIVMSKILNTVYRIALGIKAHDISTDYRMYHTEHLQHVTLENENYDVLEEVLIKIKKYNHGLKIGEVPIEFKKRMFGESKRQLLPFIWSYFKSLFKLTWIRITK